VKTVQLHVTKFGKKYKKNCNIKNFVKYLIKSVLFRREHVNKGCNLLNEDIESTNAKNFPYLSIHSKVIYKGVLKTVQLLFKKDLPSLEKSK